MGCGKTTISKLLSEKLKMPVIDMDKYIEILCFIYLLSEYKTTPIYIELRITIIMNIL